MIDCFRLMKGCVMFSRPETIVMASFLHLIELFFKVIINHIPKRQFVVLIRCIYDRLLKNKQTNKQKSYILY